MAVDSSRSSLSRRSATFSRASTGYHANIKQSETFDKMCEVLQCPICLDIAQLPVNIICFQGCGGTQNRGNTCLRNVVCQHCANQAFELDKPAHTRFAKSSGVTRCMICRDTRVNAQLLSPDKAYFINFNIMEVMDLLGMKGVCRLCDEQMESQQQLQQHYLKRCPHAVVQCRFRGCGHFAPRSSMANHEEVCPVGRGRCPQCMLYFDKSEVLLHMVASCKNRVVSCVICNQRARLPEMLQHLKLHQTQLQERVARHSEGGGSTGSGGGAGSSSGGGGGARGSGGGGGGGGRSGHPVGILHVHSHGEGGAAADLQMLPSGRQMLHATESQQSSAGNPSNSSSVRVLGLPLPMFNARRSRALNQRANAAERTPESSSFGTADNTLSMEPPLSDSTPQQAAALQSGLQQLVGNNVDIVDAAAAADGIPPAAGRSGLAAAQAQAALVVLLGPRRVTARASNNGASNHSPFSDAMGFERSSLEVFSDATIAHQPQSSPPTTTPTTSRQAASSATTLRDASRSSRSNSVRPRALSASQLALSSGSSINYAAANSSINSASAASSSSSSPLHPAGYGASHTGRPQSSASVPGAAASSDVAATAGGSTTSAEESTGLWRELPLHMHQAGLDPTTATTSTTSTATMPGPSQSNNSCPASSQAPASAPMPTAAEFSNLHRNHSNSLYHSPTARAGSSRNATARPRSFLLPQSLVVAGPAASNSLAGALEAASTLVAANSASNPTTPDHTPTQRSMLAHRTTDNIHLTSLDPNNDADGEDGTINVQSIFSPTRNSPHLPSDRPRNSPRFGLDLAPGSRGNFRQPLVPERACESPRLGLDLASARRQQEQPGSSPERHRRIRRSFSETQMAVHFRRQVEEVNTASMVAGLPPPTPQPRISEYGFVDEDFPL